MVKPPRQIEGWKEIADLLGVSIRTAQTWEKTRGLPTRRLDAGNRRKVLTDTASLAQWHEKNAARSAERTVSPTFYRSMIALAVAEGILALIGWLLYFFCPH